MIRSDGSTPSCVLLATKVLARWCRSVEGFFSRPLVVFHELEPTERQEIYWRWRSIETKGVVFWSTTIARIYSLGMREDRFRWRCGIEIRNGNGSTLQEFRGWITKRYRTRIYCFPRLQSVVGWIHWPEINPPKLLWIEGSPDLHKAKIHCEPSHIGPSIKLYHRRRKVARLTCAQQISQ